MKQQNTVDYVITQLTMTLSKLQGYSPVSSVFESSNCL